MSKFTLPALLGTALLVTIGLPAPASAQEALRDVRVAYRDLDLASPAGVAALDHRITRAVKQACPERWASDLRRRMLVSKCFTAKRAEVASQRAAVLAAATAPGRSAMSAVR